MFFSDDVQIGFYDKIKMFEKLVDNALPDFKKKHPQITKKLNRIRKIRNMFAHGDASYPCPEHIKKLQKEIIFTVVEKGEHKEITYTIDYVKQIMKDCYELNGILSGLIRELKGTHGILFDQFIKLHK